MTAASVNVLGRVAAILAIVAIAVATGSQIFAVFAPLFQRNVGAGVAAITGIFGVLTVTHTVLSLAALICGLVALTRRDLPQFASGIGVGVGAAGVIAGLVSIVIIPLAASAL